MYKSLQACRAFAALAVVVYHLGGALSMDKYFGPSFLTTLTHFGRHGVEFFFALSGFIIVFAHYDDVGQTTRLRRYLYKRLTRIYPPYWVAFLGVVLVARVFPPTYSAVVPDDNWLILRALFLVPHDPTTGIQTTSPVLAVGWSLQYEMLFYLVFALFILHRHLGYSLVAGLVALHFWPHSGAGFALSFVQAHWLLIFAMGAVVAIYVKRSPAWSRSPATLCAAAGSAILIGLCGMDVWGCDLSPVYFGLASSLTILGLVKLEDLGIVWGAGPTLQLLGAASYSIYLTHFPAISGLCTAAARLASRSVATAALAGVVIATVAVAGGVLFHWWVEAPLLRLLSLRRVPRVGEFPIHAPAQALKE